MDVANTFGSGTRPRRWWGITPPLSRGLSYEVPDVPAITS